MSYSLDSSSFSSCEIPYTMAPKSRCIHIGLVQLSTDHSLEHDWALLKESQALIFSTRVYYSSQLNIAELKSISSGIEEASKLIAVGLEMDVMAFGCTSASLAIGDKKLEELLTYKRGAVPTTNPWQAALKAFKFLGAKRIGVFSPYPDEINKVLYSELLNQGFEVPSFVSLGIEKDTEITLVSKKSMEDSIEKILSDGGVDVIFMSCTNLRVLEHIEEFEKKFSVPIVSSNSAMFWHAMTLANRKAFCPGYGVLLNS